MVYLVFVSFVLSTSTSFLPSFLPVPAVAGLLCSVLVPVLHSGGHAGPPGPPVPAQETGRSPAQGRAPRRSGGRVVGGASGGWGGGGGGA